MLFRIWIILFMWMISSISHAQSSASYVDHITRRLMHYELVQGFGNTEIHIRQAHTQGSADFTAQHHRPVCTVRGFQPLLSTHPSMHDLETRGQLIHEMTHCLITPYWHPSLPDDTRTVEERLVTHLIITAGESIADARALIEIARHDGMETAHTYFQLMMTERSRPSWHHQTTRALLSTYRMLKEQPDLVQNASDAFTASMRIGYLSAEEDLRLIISSRGLTKVWDNSLMQEYRSAIALSLDRAVDAFKESVDRIDGVAIHHTGEGVSSGDMYLINYGAGRYRFIPVIGPIGVKEYHELTQLMDEHTDTPSVLAIEALTRMRLLERNALQSLAQEFRALTEKYGTDAEIVIRRHVQNLAIGSTPDTLLSDILRAVTP